MTESAQLPALIAAIREKAERSPCLCGKDNLWGCVHRKDCDA